MIEYLTVDGGTLAYEVTGSTGRSSCSPTAWATAARPTASSSRRWSRPVTGSPRWTCAVPAGPASAGRPTRAPTSPATCRPGRPPRRPGGAGRPLHRRRRGHDRRGHGPGAGHRGGRARAVHPQPQLSLGDLRVARFRRGMLHLLGTALLGSIRQWRKYLEVAYPGTRPADWDTRLDQIDPMLREPGRMKALQADGPVHAGGRRCAAGQRPLPGPRRAGQPRPRLGLAAGRGRGDRRRPARRAGPAGDDRGCRALPARPVPRAGGVAAVLTFLAAVRA